MTYLGQNRGLVSGWTGQSREGKDPDLGGAIKLAQMGRAGASHRINYQESHETVSLEGGPKAANVTWQLGQAQKVGLRP